MSIPVIEILSLMIPALTLTAILVSMFRAEPVKVKTQRYSRRHSRS